MGDTSTSQVMQVVAAQRGRCLAGIMSAAEKSAWWGRLSRNEQVEFRQKVLDSLNVFYDLCRDVVKVTDDGSIRNQVVFDLISEIHSCVIPRADGR